jgi:hypothetical protein
VVLPRWPPHNGAQRHGQDGQDGVVLGAVVVVLGAGFVLLGVNGWAGARPGAGPDRSADAPVDRPPVPGVGSETPTSPAGRKIVATAWLVLGALFIVAAFTHQVP